MPQLTPLASLKVESHQIPAHGLTPNTSIQGHPLLIYRGVFPPNVKAGEVEGHLRSVGIVEPAWRYSMFERSHFHSTTHELLTITTGSARLLFGHEHNPNALTAVVSIGDVIVIPAGVAHRLLEDLSPGGNGFEMVGSYPKGGKQWDMCYGEPGEEGKVERIKDLSWFSRDPVFGGKVGPVFRNAGS